MIVPTSPGATLWEELTARGARPCGLGARDTLRLEAAMPLYGHELTRTIDPLQAGLGWAVKLTRAISSAATRCCACKQDKTGPVRVGLELDGKRIAREGAAVLARPAARVGERHQRHVCADATKSAMAMAYVAPAIAAVGTTWHVDVRGKAEAARVVPCRSTAESAKSLEPAALRPDSRRDRMDPQKLRYAKTHEWASLEGDVCTVGLTKFAVDQLTDIIYIDLPDVDDPPSAGDSFGEIESVKAVSDLYAPVDGEVIAVNEKLQNDPTLVSKDPYGKGWLIKVKVERAPRSTT